MIQPPPSKPLRPHAVRYICSIAQVWGEIQVGRLVNHIKEQKRKHEYKKYHHTDL